MQKKYINVAKRWYIFAYGAPGEIRTHDLLIRSQTLYPTELRAQKDKKMAEKEGFEPSRRLHDLRP